MRTLLSEVSAKPSLGRPQIDSLERELERMDQRVSYQLRRARASGATGLGTEPVAVAPIVDDLKLTLDKVYRDKRVECTLDVAPGALFRGDPGDLTEILGNLMDNAYKYCKSKVRVAGDSNTERLSLRIGDDGRGIGAELAQELGQRGKRADESVPGRASASRSCARPSSSTAARCPSATPSSAARKFESSRRAARCERFRRAPRAPARDALHAALSRGSADQRSREEILEVLAKHRVIVVCGDTGSGKTTQLPKICLEAGRGITGMIGHTQPRRIAAQAVAARLAEELGVCSSATQSAQGAIHATRPARHALIKVMTDGILLNEIRGDRRSRSYDTLIIDEAHERSLNIDFILGYLKQPRRERPDLKVIITSATIDPERFARHFGDAPIVLVEGRSFPVDVRYRPVDEDQDLATAVTAAANELAAERARGRSATSSCFYPASAGSATPSERSRATARRGTSSAALRAAHERAAAQDPRARQSTADRARDEYCRNSLTVPRIRYVIDSGLARVSRYGTRHRVQSLGVEPIAQANAVQRAGRCGRLAPGVCVRLYSEEDFAERPEFTEPEILRTGLAGVLLRLESLRLGPVEEFPFIDAPPAKAVSDAYQLLYLLGAVDADKKLTSDGALMARLPVDPRVARLLVVANQNGALHEGLVIAAALSVVDPRETRRRPGRGAPQARGARRPALGLHDVLCRSGTRTGTSGATASARYASGRKRSTCRSRGCGVARRAHAAARARARARLAHARARGRLSRDPPGRARGLRRLHRRARGGHDLPRNARRARAALPRHAALEEAAALARRGRTDRDRAVLSAHGGAGESALGVARCAAIS